MAGAFADHVELALEGVGVEMVGGSDEELFDRRLAGQGRRADVGLFRPRGHDSPSEHSLSLLGDDSFDGLLRVFALRGNRRQKDHAGAILTAGRQPDAEIFLGDLCQEVVRERCQHPGPVPGVGFATACSAMSHVAQHFIGVDDDLVAMEAFDMRHESHTTRIVLERRIVQCASVRPPPGRFGPKVLNLFCG